MASFIQNDFGFPARAVLWAQRNSWRLPRGLRRAGTKLIGKGNSSWGREGAVEDWSKPLVPYHPNHVTAVPELHPTTSPKNGFAEVASSRQDAHCLIVTQELDTGGLDEFVAFLARRLPFSGFRVTVMCALSSSNPKAGSRAGHLCMALRREGTTVVVASESEGRQWLAANRTDVISAHDPPDWILEQAGSVGIPIVETLHGIPTPISTDWSREVKRAKFITSFVAVSDLVRRQYLKGNPSFPERAIVVVPNAFNDTHRPACDRAIARDWLGLSEEFLFITLGRYSIQKNAYGLVDAFSEVAYGNSNAHLLIAGRLDNALYACQVRALRDKSPAKERIHLRDSFSNPSLLFAAADCFVLNSFFEGWSLASMEALSAGLPAILSEVGGAREQLGTDGSRGFIVANPLGSAESANWKSAAAMRFRRQPNRDELVAAMNSVIAHRDQWAAARRQLSESSKERFSATICVKRHADVLLDVISRR